MLKEIVLPPIDMKKFSDQPIDSNLIIMSHDFNVNELVIPFYETNVFDTYEAFYSFQGNTSIIIQEVYKKNNEIRIPIVNDVRRHKGIFTIELNASSGSTQATLLKLNVMVKRSNIDSNSEFLFNHYYKLFEDYKKEIAELNNDTQTTIKTQLKQSQDNLQKVTKTLIAINDKVMVINDTTDGFMADVATKQADVTSKYNAFDTSVTEANQTIDELLALQPQFQAVLDETTGKDVISAPEIILARGGEANLKARLDKEHQEVNAQLAQTVSLSKYMSSSLSTRKKGKRPIVTFISDDGAIKDYTKLKPIIEDKKIPVGLGIVTSWVGTNGFMTYDQIREMESIGCEIMAHTHEHRDSATLTEEELDLDVKTNVSQLRQHGFYPKGFVYPFNSYNDWTMDIVRKYFDMSFAKVYSENLGKNYLSMINQAIKRVALGSYFDNPPQEFPQDGTSLEYYKSRVDEALETSNWLVFVLHPAATDDNQFDYLKQVIDYVRGLNIDIVSPTEGFEIYGNVMDIRGSKDVIIDADGNVNMTDNIVVLDDYNGRHSSDDLTSFVRGKVYLTPINNLFATNEGFPEGKGGYLITRRLSTDYYHASQEYIPILGTKKSYKRYGNRANTWGDWSSSDGAQDTVHVSKMNAYTPTSRWVSFPIYKITHTIITSSFASSNNFPSDYGGALITNRISTDYWTGSQEYIESDTLSNRYIPRKWLRYVDSDLNWTKWVLTGSSTGSITQRPSDALVGHCYFDLNLGKPVWLKTSPSTWVDATGAEV